MLADAVGRLFGDAAAEPRALADGWNAALWAQVEAIGLPLMLVPEAAGGIGAGWEDAFVVLHPLGYHAIALPVAETLLAARLLSGAGLAVPDGPLTVAPAAQGRLERGGDGRWRFSGTLSAVPWGAQAGHIAASVLHEGQPTVVLLPRARAATVQHSANLAGEPRATLTFSSADASAAPSARPEAVQLLPFCALLRVAQSAGALESALVRTIAYARERTQFGKPIGQFQAVQQQLALLGNEAAAVACAARVALRAADRLRAPEHAGFAAFDIAAAKLRANLAINTGTAIAHQVHGAIGFTREYDLRHATQRLWSWRSEFGNDRYWSGVLGAMVAQGGADDFWRALTRRGDQAASAALL
jgi:acyl-CoA dehydrogenase